MLVSTLLCALLTTLPRIAVYGTRISPESAIVLAAGAIYLASVGWSRAAAGRVSGQSAFQIRHLWPLPLHFPPSLTTDH